MAHTSLKVLMEKYNLQRLDFEPHLYTRVKTEEQLEKEGYYNEEGLQREDYLDMVEPQELTPRDVRLLARAEDELSQCKLYTRIFLGIIVYYQIIIF